MHTSPSGAVGRTRPRCVAGLREPEGELRRGLVLLHVVGRVARARDGRQIGRQPQMGEDASRGLALGDDGDHA